MFIENNVTSSDLSAARRMSDEVVTQIFGELKDEADNSISDSEKLEKVLFWRASLGQWVVFRMTHGFPHCRYSMGGPPICNASLQIRRKRESTT